MVFSPYWQHWRISVCSKGRCGTTGETSVEGLQEDMAKQVKKHRKLGDLQKDTEKQVKSVENQEICRRIRQNR